MFSTFIRNQQKVWFEMFPRLFEIKHTQFSVVLAGIFHLPCSVISEVGRHQLFYNRSGSYKIHVLPVLNFLVYRFHENMDYLKTHIQPNFNPFPATHVIFYIHQIKKRLIKRQLKMLDIVQKKMYRTTHWRNTDLRKAWLNWNKPLFSSGIEILKPHFEIHVSETSLHRKHDISLY